MTVQEWLHDKLNDQQKRKQHEIYLMFCLQTVSMTNEEEIELKKFLAAGEMRQKDVVSFVSKELNVPLDIIRCEVRDLMYMEPYEVFYKKYFLGEPSNFTNINDCIAKAIQIITSMPSDEEFLLDAQRGNFQQRIPYYGLEPFLKITRTENITSTIKGCQ